MSLSRLEPYIVIAIALLILFLSFSPFLYNYLATPKNHVFTGAHNYPPDYLDCLAQIKSGLEGHFFYISKFTTESFLKPIFTTFPYTTLGLLGKVVGINSPAFLYHVSRLVLGTAYLLVIYFFISFYFKNPLQRLCAFTLAVFSSSLPRIISGKFAVYLADYTFLDAMQRTTFLPHHLLRNIYLYLLFFFFLVIATKGRKLSKRILALLGIIGFQLSLLSPQHSLVFLATIFVFLAVETFRSRKFSKKFLNFIIATALPIFLGTLILYSTFLSGPIGKAVKAWDLRIPPFPLAAVFLALGPIFFLSLPGLLNKKTYQKKFLLLLIFIAITIFFTVSPIKKYLPISYSRFLQIPLFPALSILAIQGIQTFSRQNLVLIGSVTLSLLLSFPSYLVSFQSQTTYHLKNPTNFYIKRVEFEALNFLDQNIAETDNIMANEFSGNLIPAFTGNRVFEGHPISTYKLKQKIKMANDFFSGKMSPEEAKNLFVTHNLKYIWFGELEAAWGVNLPRAYPTLSLKTIYRNSSITVYQVRGFNK